MTMVNTIQRRLRFEIIAIVTDLIQRQQICALHLFVKSFES